MKAFLTAIGKIAAAGLIAVVILSAISLVYDYSGIKTEDMTGVTGSKAKPFELMTNMTEGFGFFRFDGRGYNNDEAVSDIDTLLIGSSHIEAVQVMRRDNMASVLNRDGSLGMVYNIGVSGRKIYSFVGQLKRALDEYKPSRYVLIELNSLQLDADSMQNVIDLVPEKTETLKGNSGIAFYLKQIPCVKPLFYQIDNWMKNTASENDTKTPENPIDMDEYGRTVKAFLSVAAAAAKKHGVTPVFFFHNQELLQPDGSVLYSDSEEYVGLFSSACSELGMIFVDTTQAFSDFHKQTGQMCHGFINTSVGKGHINANGHRIIAEEIIKAVGGNA